jgi:ATP-binding cassette, subfamily B, bacterial
VRGRSTARVAWRLVVNNPPAFFYAWIQWVAFHLAPLLLGWLLKVVLDRLTAGPPASPWWPLAVLAGLEVARWALLVSAAVQWHGAFVGWLTVPRVNVLRSLATDPGPVSGRLPGSPGEAVSRFRDDAQDVGLVLDGWLDVSGAVLAAAGATVVMVSIDPVAAVAVVVPVSVALLAAWWLGPRLRAWRRSAREATGSVTGFIGDTFGAVLAVKAAGAEGAVAGRFAVLNAERARLSRRDQVGRELIRSLGYGTGEVTVGIVLLLVAASFRRGELSVGDIGLFASYVPVIAGVPKWVGRLAAYQRQADVSVDRLAELLAPADRRAVTAPVRTYLRTASTPPEPAAPSDDPLEELSVRGLVVRHPSGRGVHGVDLVVRPGELVVVTGQVGSGKSTLLRGLLGLVPHQEGEIRWNGSLVDDPSTVFVPPRVAYLPQVPRLFSETLSDTVLLGRPGERLERALWLSCMDEEIDEMPQGAATVIGARGLRLSGGQAQRTASARALAGQPDLLVVDDLSSALDVETELRLWGRLGAGGFVTALLVSHREHVLQRADRVIVLDEGRVMG